MLDDKRIIPKSELKEIERTLFINAFNSIQSLSRMRLFLEQNAQEDAENRLNKEAGANLALLLSAKELDFQCGKSASGQRAIFKVTKKCTVGASERRA